MQTEPNLGWRKLSPGQRVFEKQDIEADRAKLYKVKNLAARALRLSKGQISLLTSLISYFKEPVGGKLLVWPSNDSLEKATGYSERAVRGAIRDLISIGILSSKDSANGKRFAIRSKSQQIIDAYGFDLTPLLLRESEFKDSIKRIEAAEEIHKRQLDEITISRRTVQEVLRAFPELDPGIDVSALERRFDALMSVTPRRSLIRIPGPLLADWNALKLDAEHQYHSASAGNSCRHIEDNNDIPEQPCQNGKEELVRGETVSLGDLKAACPDALEYAGEIRTEGDLIGAAARLRGVFGTHRTAWEEACDDLGRPRAAVTFFLVLQMFDDDQRGRRTITNFGGLFRAYARRAAAGEVNLAQEIHALKRKRQH
ncbi:plasmid replication protein RepC [Pararhizobium qamdonense]|uniref:plasmid replication protein RepC n=1 Tax=Pararhizobium qamdonense TaxID=3031126 RepID=UPI0023E2DE2A|nr:plasmid replication protein RepC [Pararhizobium qamdonense]